MAIKSNIVIDQGTDFEVTVNVKDANNTIVELTGYTGKAQLRKYYTSSKQYNFGVTIAANTGGITLAMSASNTAVLQSGRYLYDCTIVSPANVVSRIVEGIVTVAPRVTR